MRCRPGIAYRPGPAWRWKQRPAGRRESGARGIAMPSGVRQYLKRKCDDLFYMCGVMCGRLLGGNRVLKAARHSPSDSADPLLDQGDNGVRSSLTHWQPSLHFYPSPPARPMSRSLCRSMVTRNWSVGAAVSPMRRALHALVKPSYHRCRFGTPISSAHRYHTQTCRMCRGHAHMHRSLHACMHARAAAAAVGCGGGRDAGTTHGRSDGADGRRGSNGRHTQPHVCAHARAHI